MFIWAIYVDAGLSCPGGHRLYLGLLAKRRRWFMCLEAGGLQGSKTPRLS